jgi:phage gpG-like protein
MTLTELFASSLEWEYDKTNMTVELPYVVVGTKRFYAQLHEFGTKPKKRRFFTNGRKK